jgi:hypothetical protein
MMNQILWKVVRGLNLTVIVDNSDVIAGCECIKGIAFNNAVSWVKCALLPIMCAIFGISHDNCVQFDRVEYLSPQSLAT